MTAEWTTPRIVALDRSPYERAPHGGRDVERITHLGRHDARGLIARHGSPVVVYDAERLRAAYDRFESAFAASWRKIQIAYSVKTNYLSAIVALLKSQGATVEVVSGFEYAICRRLGIDGRDIHFNGPYKSDVEIAEAFANHSLVNVDNRDELERLDALARRLGGRHRVGIRVNMEVSYPPWDKFGFALSSGDAMRAARRIHAHPNLDLELLHMHIGTYIPNPDQYEKGAAALVELALRIGDETGKRPAALDLGGGYASTNRLRGQRLPGTATSPTPEMYAASLTRPLIAARDRHGYEPLLVLEPGRAVVDESADLLATVTSVKPLLGGGKAAILDAGVNVLPTAYWYDHECVPVGVEERPLEAVKLFGALCMQIDVVRPSVVLPAPRAGDVYCLRRVGAYNFSQSMTFIFPRPAHVLIDGDQEHVIRRAETVDDVLRNESVPASLAVKKGRRKR